MLRSGLRLAVFARCDADETFEVFAEERRVGETEVVGNPRHRFVGVQQFHLDAHDEGTVNPFLGTHPAGLADDAAQITLGQADAVGIERKVVMFGTMQVDEADETVEDALSL